MISRTQSRCKRLLDLVAGAVLLLFAAPVFALTAILIKSVSRGPVFFVQERVGYQEQPFRIYKFRTMHTDAAMHHFGSVTVANDPRLFPGAKILRQWKIDELPQLLNVLNGTMTLVGPRPTVESDRARMSDRQRGRYSLRPGLTGMAQIRGGAALPWPRRIELDLWHIEHYSIWLDLKILLETAVLVLCGKADSNPISSDEWALTESESVHCQSIRNAA